MSAVTTDLRITAQEGKRRRRMVDQAIAAQMRQGYTHDPALEAAVAAYVRGDLDFEGLDQALRLHG